MATLFVFLALYLVLSSPTSSSPAHSLSKSSSLSVEKPDNVLISPNGVFSAGFHPVGVNAYSFAIWFTKTTQNHTTVIWMANRDQPVNGRLSKLSLLKDGNLILTDANNRSIFWATNTASSSLSLQLRLQNSVPNQPLTRYTQLVSKRSEANHSSGFYKLIFDRDNVLRLVFDGPETSSNYWPDPWLLSNEANRSSLEETSGNWAVSWQAMSRPCRIHGACGPNSICNFDPSSGRKCSCLPWFKMRNPKDWFDGCEPEFNLSCSGGNQSPTTFLKLPHTDFYGYNIHILQNYTLEMCEKKCLSRVIAKGSIADLKRTVEFTTATKWVFHNGHHSPNVVGMLYAKMPKALMSIIHEKEPLFTYFKFKWNCSGQAMKQLNRTYEKRNQNGSSEQLLWFACALGVLEMITITLATLVKWVMEKVMNRGSPMTSWVGEIVDPMLNGAYDAGKVEKLVEVALQCLEEEKDARPTMTRVVDMLQR
ncbi:putative receptor protein kinase ZmPK1 [Camellia lanceoleosa]|uniref:Receptor protein kinase ZmPK1 n=1 Tax=Camellia lanceoleosa TaxID=1840588 RepID=A0ACC0FQC7_9ERIC|nr:putative receptor protein kinase ZmPK1 [Camellia lanceoleosa]